MTGGGYHVLERAGKILVIAIVVLSVVLIFIYFVHLYAKWFLYQNHQHQRRRRRREDFSGGYQDQQQQSGVTVLRRGLNPSVLETIPVIPFDPKQGHELECTVCLSQVCEGEKTRILPKCNHAFHVECIDMWLYSHSTCPICRNPLDTQIPPTSILETHEQQQQQDDDDDDEELTVAAADFPTNILFWGDETQVSTLTSQPNTFHQTPSSSESQTRQDLVIDIPSLPTQSQIDCDQDKKSPVSSSRMRSLRRIFISPFSPALEQPTRGGHL